MPTAAYSLIAAAVSIVLSAAAAKADCAFSPFAFFPDRNDRVEVNVVTDGRSFCDNSFREGPGYRFTDVRVIAAPPHGLIATLGRTVSLIAPSQISRVRTNTQSAPARLSARATGAQPWFTK